MEVLIEYFLTSIIVIILIAFILFAYYKKHQSETKINIVKIEKAKEFGFHEPVSLHPVINEDICIGSGGGDSAIESALLLAEEGNNHVTLSYRSNSFKRAKPKNIKKIDDAKSLNKISLMLESNVKEITNNEVKIELKNGSQIPLANDLVYIFAGGELPNKFLEKIGIKITKKFGEAVLKH